MRDFIEQYWEKVALPALMEFGRIPNVSPAYAPNWETDGHMERAAQFLKPGVEGRPIKGLTIEIVRIFGKTPTIFIQVPGRTDASILMYGHMDKQPGMDGWRTGLGPWTPVREGDNLYGRGLADDGYAIFAALGAVEIAQQSGGTLPTVSILIEGSEESGSFDLPAYLDLLKDKIGTPDVAITLDCDGRDEKHLTLTESLRGLVNGMLTIETLDNAMHSGMGTGVVPSAMRIMRMLLDRIEDPATGQITNTTINPPMPAHMCTVCDKMSAGCAQDFIASYELPQGLKAMAPNDEEAVKQNLWSAGMEVVGITGLPAVEVAGNVMHPKIVAKLSFRIPPLVDCRSAAEELKRVFESDPPYGARVTFVPTEFDNGWCAQPLSDKTEKVLTKTAHDVYGTTPLTIGIGASIPFIGMIASRFPKADNIVTGVLTPTTHEHGPNEHLPISATKRLTEWLARFIAEY